MPDRPPRAAGSGGGGDPGGDGDPNNAGAPTQEPDARRLEMDATPPFFTWRTIYTIVLGGLAAQVVLYAVVSAFFRGP